MHWVLMCSGGSSKKITGAVNSALNQTELDVSVLIIDDSGDPNYRLKFDSNRVEIKKNIKNIGYTRSLNIGLSFLQERSKHSSVKSVSILDDDDIWIDKSKIEKQFRFLMQNPDFYLVSTRCNVVNKKNKVIEEGDCQYTGIVDKNKILKYNPIIHSSVMYSGEKIFADSIRYNEAFIRTQDWAMWLDLLVNKHKVIYVLPDITINYLYDDSLSAKLKKKKNDFKSAHLLNTLYPELSIPTGPKSYLLDRLKSLKG
ncbi:glycosyltransferase family 2 protein [Gammaproteobacteria bacterium]|nr:glycosyltransferase family 2 protein [Gammaproteobacteria bacterium]